MKILVGWWDPSTGTLLTINEFDHVQDTTGWLPAFVEIHRSKLDGVLKAMVSHQ